VPLEMVIFNGAGSVTRALQEDAWDIAFLAIDPDRHDIIAFTDPYVQIEGTYAVRSEGGIASVDDADREGIRIVASVGSAYELHLRRTLRHAKLVPADMPAASMQAFLDGEGDAVAGVRQTLEAFFKGREGFRVLPDRITAIAQAMAVPTARAAAVPHLNKFLARLQQSGFIDAERIT
jgi:polar amino acid transport system substrate-binding protein